MARTLLVGAPGWTWREWLKENRVASLLCLDPSNADHGPPGRAYLWSAGKSPRWRFIGSSDPVRSPVALFQAAWTLSEGCDTVLLFPVRDSPIARQLATSIAQALALDRILVPLGSGLAPLGWPVGAEETSVPEELPAMVLEAQRRAQWLTVLESTEEHVVDLRSVATEGARLGSGRALELQGWKGWAEVSGSVLHLVGDQEPDEQQVSQFLDDAGARRLSVVSPASYVGLTCSFASQEGEDFGIGFIRSFLPERGMLEVACTAVAPAPVRILRLGAMRIDGGGRELAESKPWLL
ncbi:MAG: hypothetical protein JSS66_10265 [Armatimonadetes bacterium]|nr:hypothetical protein [Armatimonadota bacterium]